MVYDGGLTMQKQSQISSMERVKALNGGIAIQDRMAFQGEYFVDLYGKEAAAYSSDLSYVRPWYTCWRR